MRSERSSRHVVRDTEGLTYEVDRVADSRGVRLRICVVGLCYRVIAGPDLPAYWPERLERARPALAPLLAPSPEDPALVV